MGVANGRGYQQVSVASRCGYQQVGVASGLNGIGVVSGYCFKEVYGFPHITYP